MGAPRCPICLYRFGPWRLVFGGYLPWRITCPDCRTRLTLERPVLFWGHFALYVGVMAGYLVVTMLTEKPSFERSVWIDVGFVMTLSIVFLVLLGTVLTGMYGLRALNAKKTG